MLVKRGMSATLDEFLMSAEYVMSEGNYQVILCERGVRTFADHTRNTLDLSIVPAVQRLSHLPILVDPSHGTGKRNKVVPLARAAVAVGADGIMVEVHHQPEKALSDGPQSIYPAQFAEMMDELEQIAAVLHRTVPRGIHLETAALVRAGSRHQVGVVACRRLALANCRGAGGLPQPRLSRIPCELSRIRLRFQWRQQHGLGLRRGESTAGPAVAGGCEPDRGDGESEAERSVRGQYRARRRAV